MREEPIVVGIVLDLSLRHSKDGLRIVDVVKEQLVEYVRAFDYVDLFYLYHENVVDVVEGLGKRIHSVASYQTDGFEFDISYALKQTLYIIGSEDDDKRVYLVTDRFSEKTLSAVRKIAMLNEKDGLECEIYVIALGDRNNQLALKSLDDEGFANVLLKEPSELNSILLEEYNGTDSGYGADAYEGSDSYGDSDVGEEPPSDIEEPQSTSIHSGE